VSSKVSRAAGRDREPARRIKTEQGRSSRNDDSEGCAGLIETRIDEAERRIWFMFEATCIMRERARPFGAHEARQQRISL
jgi:hypothetical protein